MTTTLLPTLQLWGPINCEHSDLSNLKRTVRSILHSLWTQYNFPHLSRYQRVCHTQPHARRISRFRRVRIPAHSTFAVSQSLSNLPHDQLGCHPPSSPCNPISKSSWSCIESRSSSDSRLLGAAAKSSGARRSFASRPVLHK